MVAKVSIVIPAYNAEEVLERSVRSVLAQTLREIEVWIVDDGSRDSTGKIADRLAREDSRVRVLHQDNSGCYQARLNALKRIKALYFGFVDADDTVAPEMFEKMLAFAERETLDVVQCGHDVNGRIVEWKGDSGLLLSHEEVVEKYVTPLLVEGTLGGAFVWNKLYRNQYDFSKFDPTDKDTTFEDMIFNLQFFLKVQRMGFVNEPLYHYCINEDSSVRNFTAKTLKDFGECIRVRKAIIPLYGIKRSELLCRRWMRTNVVSCIVSAMRSRLPLWSRIKNVIGILKLAI